MQSPLQISHVLGLTYKRGQWYEVEGGQVYEMIDHSCP